MANTGFYEILNRYMKCRSGETKMNILMTWNMKPILVNQIVIKGGQCTVHSTIIKILIDTTIVFIKICNLKDLSALINTSTRINKLRPGQYTRVVAFLCPIMAIIKETRIIMICLQVNAHWNVMTSYVVIVVKSDLGPALSPQNVRMI